ncbi:MAG TPA: hypothetical protein PL051_03315 [Candidatus Saccharibacteria bacterium]|nr:hypothetical protein [Candidatus Saccharibacteria bacterium]
MAGGKAWGWPKGEKGERRTPADYEREAAQRVAVDRDLGAAGAAAALETPRIFEELRAIKLGSSAPTVERATEATGFSQKHDNNPNTTAVLDELVENGDLHNN